MSERYLRLICNPDKWYEVSGDPRSRLVNTHLKDKNPIEWYVGNLKYTHECKYGIIKVSHDKRRSSNKPEKLERGIYAIFKVLKNKNDTKTNFVEIEITDNFYLKGNIIGLELLSQALKTKLNSPKQGYIDKCEFGQIKNLIK